MIKAWKRVLTGVNLLLAVGCVVSGVLVGRQVLQAKESFNSEVQVPIPQTREVSKPTTHHPVSYYHVITERQLFGVVSKDVHHPAKRLDEKDIANLPKTPLQLSLKATIAFDDQKLCFAIIEDLKTRKQDLYKVGSKIAEAEIIGIYPDKVVLSRAGKEEVLLLFEGDKLSKTPPEKEKPSSGSTPKPKQTEVPKPSKVSDNKWEIKSEQINEVAKMAPEVITQANIAAYQPSGKIEGFKIDNIVPGSLYEQYGLKNGDVIKRVNGEVIDGINKAVSLGQRLLSEEVSTVTVEIERDGSTITLNYDIKR